MYIASIPGLPTVRFFWSLAVCKNGGRLASDQKDLTRGKACMHGNKARRNVCLAQCRNIRLTGSCSQYLMYRYLCNTWTLKPQPSIYSWRTWSQYWLVVACRKLLHKKIYIWTLACILNVKNKVLVTRVVCMTISAWMLFLVWLQYCI